MSKWVNNRIMETTDDGEHMMMVYWGTGEHKTENNDHNATGPSDLSVAK